MDDSRALGLIVPSTNTVVERELPHIMSGIADLFVSRVMQQETEDPEAKIGTVMAMHDGLDLALEQLSALSLRAVGFACTAASFLEGAEADLQMRRRFSQATGIPFLTASGAVTEALRALGARRVALVTPYIVDVNEKEIDYLASLDFDVVESSGMGLVGNLPKGRLPATASAERARALSRDGADVVFLSCTNWLTVGNIDDLEAEFGIPVISSNSALGWQLARVSGFTGGLHGIGRLGHRTGSQVVA